MIRALVFDCFGVVVDDVFTTVARRYTDNMDAVNRINKLAELGKISDDERGLLLEEQCGAKAPEFRQALLHALEHAKLHKNIIDDISKLRNYYRTAMLSNTSEKMFKKFFPGDLARHYFDEIILSYEEKVAKPDREMFERLTRRMRVTPEECLYMDDTEENLVAAEKLGMKTIRYHSEEDFRHRLEQFGVLIMQ